MQSRSWVPLDIPISTAAGHIRSPEFEINLEGEYWIYVDVDRQFKPDSIECLLGLPPYYNDCHDHPSIVQTSWRITKAGNEVARDHNIAPVRVGPWDRVGRAIGSFAADKSKHYALDLDILADASELNGGNPRLKIEELGGAYVRYSSLEDDWSNVAFLLVVTGIVLLVVVLVGWARERDRGRLQLTTVGPQPQELFFDHNDAEARRELGGIGEEEAASLFLVRCCACLCGSRIVLLDRNVAQYPELDTGGHANFAGARPCAHWAVQGQRQSWLRREDGLQLFVRTCRLLLV